MNTYEKASFINDIKIRQALEQGKKSSEDETYVLSLIEKASTGAGLSHEETSVLLHITDPILLEKLYETAKKVKETIYGKRIVLFAPLYVSNYCVNQCVYCGYKQENTETHRKKLNKDELIQEIRVLQNLGHKRLTIEAGEDPVHAPIEYILDCIDTIYSMKFDNGSIRRVNINIAATTIENYRKLHEANIGTYILFQETYHKETYEKLHPKGPKHNYDYHTTAMDRAMLGGIDDVGVGVLYGLYDYKYDTVAMMLHKEHLEDTFGVGPHTISIPRLKAAEGVSLKNYPHLIDDETFKKLTAIIRLSVPYTGLILSTREGPGFREEVMALGVSQISSGSCTGVGGYTTEYEDPTSTASLNTSQFEVEDLRSPMEILKNLCESGYIPSYCTACYASGRTGDRFMRLAKSGQINNVCLPNALMTLKEYLIDYGDSETQEVGNQLIEDSLKDIKSEKVRKLTEEQLEKIHTGERNLYL